MDLRLTPLAGALEWHLRRERTFRPSWPSGSVLQRELPRDICWIRPSQHHLPSWQRDLSCMIKQGVSKQRLTIGLCLSRVDQPSRRKIGHVCELCLGARVQPKLPYTFQGKPSEFRRNMGLVNLFVLDALLCCDGGSGNESNGRFANRQSSEFKDRDVGASTSAGHPDMTALLPIFPTRCCAMLTGSLQHLNGKRLCINFTKSTHLWCCVSSSSRKGKLLLCEFQGSFQLLRRGRKLSAYCGEILGS